MKCTTCGAQQKHHRLATVRSRCDSPGGMGTYGEDEIQTERDIHNAQIIELRSMIDSLRLEAGGVRDENARFRRTLRQVKDMAFNPETDPNTLLGQIIRVVEMELR